MSEVVQQFEYYFVYTQAKGLKLIWKSSAKLQPKSFIIQSLKMEKFSIDNSSQLLTYIREYKKYRIRSFHQNFPNLMNLITFWDFILKIKSFLKNG